MADVTELVLRVYRCDERLDGLQSRLRAAERFLGEQERRVSELTKRRASIAGQMRQLEASMANEEGESARLAERIAHLKEQMNTASTSKAYQALLTEVKTFELKKAEHDKAALGHLEQVEKLRAELDATETRSEDQGKIRDVAAGDRAKRADEIREQLETLRAERDRLAAEVPPEILKLYEDLRRERGEEAMAPLMVEDARRHEYTCGSSMMSVPVEVANSLLLGKLTVSPNNGCILYLTEEARERMSAVRR